MIGRASLARRVDLRVRPLSERHPVQGLISCFLTPIPNASLFLVLIHPSTPSSTQILRVHRQLTTLSKTHFPFPTPPQQLSQNDWRQIWRQSQRQQERAIVSAPSSDGICSSNGVNLTRHFEFHLHSSKFITSPIQSSSTDIFLSQPVLKSWSRIPCRPCPPSLAKGQLRPACRCWCPSLPCSRA